MKKTIGKAKGVCCFAVDWQTLRVQCEKQELRICVAAKKKLNFFEYKRGEFIPYKVCMGQQWVGVVEMVVVVVVVVLVMVIVGMVLMVVG